MPESTNRIRALRELRVPRWTQEDLARAVGCSRCDIAKYERGERVPSVIMGIKIAKALGASVEVVFSPPPEEQSDDRPT